MTSSIAHWPQQTSPADWNHLAFTEQTGTCPDGVTASPWFNGKFLVWHVMFVDTFCTSRKCVLAKEAGEAAALAEKEKTRKYVYLDRAYLFQPVAVGTCGSVGPCRLIALSVVSNWRAPVFPLPASAALHGHLDRELLLCDGHSGASRTPGYCQHVVNACTLEVLPTTSVTVTCLVSSPLFTAAPWIQMHADYCRI